MAIHSKQAIKNQRILGIDPGSRIAGFAFIENSRGAVFTPKDFRLIEAGIMRVSEKLPPFERLGLLHEQLFQLLEEFQPTVCVMERAFYGVNALSALRIGEARGAFIAALQRKHIPLIEVTPAHVKKTIAGNGRATKEQLHEVLRLIWKFNKGQMPFDVSDALAIAITHGLTQRGTYDQTHDLKRRPASQYQSPT